MIATTRAALIRGTSQDALGDEVDSVDPVAGFTDFPASILEVGRREFDPASNTWRTVRDLVGRVPSNVPVHDGDRLRDNRDGAIYAIDGFRRTPRSLSGRASVTLALRRTQPVNG